MGALLTKRLRTVWLPGLSAVILADVFPKLFFRGKLLSGLRINVDHPPLRVSLFVPWLWGLVAVGGLASYLSRRAGGGICERLLASLFPAFVQLVYCVALLHYTAPGEPGGKWGYLLSGYINLAIAPSIFLLVGTIPFLKAAPGKTGAPGEHPR
jgi:hypothetical protein